MERESRLESNDICYFRLLLTKKSFTAVLVSNAHEITNKNEEMQSPICQFLNTKLLCCLRVNDRDMGSFFPRTLATLHENEGRCVMSKQSRCLSFDMCWCRGCVSFIKKQLGSFLAA